MATFEELCQQAEQMPKEAIYAFIGEKAKRILPAFNELTESAEDAASLFMSFLIGSVVADNTFNEDEFNLIRPCIEAFFGKKLSFNKALDLIRSHGTIAEIIERTDRIVDEIGNISPELKEDLVIVSLVVCAIDGHVTEKEKEYISRLLA